MRVDTGASQRDTVLGLAALETDNRVDFRAEKHQTHR